MIIYDGVSLESVADVKIEDVRVSPIEFEQVAHPRAIRGGSDFVRNRAGTRSVVITFAVLDNDEVTRQQKIMAISGWAKNDKEYKLELPGHPEHYLMAICTKTPDPSLRQWWESKLMLVFTCFGLEQSRYLFVALCFAATLALAVAFDQVFSKLLSNPAPSPRIKI